VGEVSLRRAEKLGIFFGDRKIYEISGAQEKGNTAGCGTENSKTNNLLPLCLLGHVQNAHQAPPRAHFHNFDLVRTKMMPGSGDGDIPQGSVTRIPKRSEEKSHCREGTGEGTPSTTGDSRGSDRIVSYRANFSFGKI